MAGSKRKRKSEATMATPASNAPLGLDADLSIVRNDLPFRLQRRLGLIPHAAQHPAREIPGQRVTDRNKYLDTEPSHLRRIR
jgi:hypothetical protein